MNIKKTVLFFFLLTTVTFSPFVFNEIYIYRSDHFSCLSKIELSDETRKFSAEVKHKFDGGKGEVDILGEYSELGKEAQRLNYQLRFDYTYYHDEIIMVSTGTTLKDVQARMLDALIPDFYLFKDRGFRNRIYRQGDTGYVFITYDVPVLICTKL